MGQFADMNLPAMNDAEVDEFERLLEIPDPQILDWITGVRSDSRRARHAAFRPPVRRAAGSAQALGRQPMNFVDPPSRGV